MKTIMAQLGEVVIFAIVFIFISKAFSDIMLGFANM
jgi:hypothetical protein